MPSKKEANEAGEKATKEGKATAKDASKFSAMLTRLQKDLREMDTEGAEFKTHEKLRDENATLRNAGDQKDQEILALKNKLDEIQELKKKSDAESKVKIGVLVDTFEERSEREKALRASLGEVEMREREKDKKLEALSSGNGKLEKRKNELEKEVREQNQRVEKDRKQRKELQVDLDLKKSQLAQSRVALEKCEAKIEELQIQRATSKLDLSPIKIDFEKLAGEVESLANNHFNRTVSRPDIDVYIPKQILDHVPDHSLPDYMSNIPRPKNNSPNAMLMRVAFAHATIGWALSEFLFQQLPTGILPDSIFPNAQRLLKWVEKQNVVRSSIVRCQILKICPPDGPSEVFKRVFEAIHQTLSPWLEGETSQSKFGDDLQEILQRAVDLWLTLLQYHGAAPVAVLKRSVGWAFENDCSKIYGDRSMNENSGTLQQTHEFEEPVAVLFPYIRVGEEPVCYGHALFACQEAYRAACDKSAPSSPIFQQRKRRPSEVIRQNAIPERHSSVVSRANSSSTTSKPPADLAPSMAKPRQMNGKA